MGGSSHTAKLLFIAVLLTTACVACDVVVVEKPFGDIPAEVNGEDWEGYWNFGDEDLFRVRVADAGKGILEAASIEDSGNSMDLDRSTIHLREAGGWKFMFVSGETEDTPYDWYKYENYEGRMILLWLPATDKFKAAVDRGLLKAEVKTKRIKSPGSSPLKSSEQTIIVLKELGKKEIDLITSEDEGIFFEWQTPLPIMKAAP